MAVDREAALALVPLFASLPRSRLRRLAGKALIYEYEPGEPLVQEGTRGETLFVIVDGSVRVSRRGRTLRRLKAGEFFGEVAVLDGRPRSVSISADSRVRCVVLHRDELRAFVESEPKLAWHMLGVVASRLRD